MQDPSLYSQIKPQVQPNPQYPDQEHLKCPRCDSTNTKFCYYNNYNLSQPRHFCKNCKRYWTKGGALRNIPVGGGSRKNAKRSSSSAAGNNHQNKRLAVAGPASSSGSVIANTGQLNLNYGGQFGNFAEGRGGLSLFLEGQFGNFGDGMGKVSGPSLRLKERFGGSDLGSGENLDPQVGSDGFLNVDGVGSESGCWYGGMSGLILLCPHQGQIIN